MTHRLLTMACVALAAPTIAFSQDTLDVPRLPAPVIDGVLSQDEWRGAATRRLSDGSEVLLAYDGRFLYLGVRAARPGFVSACVARNDTVRVLHASAALGNVMYVPTGNTWSLSGRFVWGLRAREMSDDTRRRQRQYLDSAGWLASTFNLSETGKELQIPLDLMDAERRLAFGYFVANDGPVLAFPDGLSDGCPDQRVVSGFLPPTVGFRQREWVRLNLRVRSSQQVLPRGEVRDIFGY